MSKKIFLSRYCPTYAEAVKKAGMELTDRPTLADGLILTGGGDIATCAYNEPKMLADDPDPYRDQEEFFLIKKFLLYKKPIFGICRGLQIINVYFGGSLYQHIDRHGLKNGKVDSFHEITVVKNTFLDKIYRGNIHVNSAHHQGVKKIGSGLKIAAKSPDGIIEALYKKGIIATQFHPERMGDEGLKIFKYFQELL